jgi:hypothetical protein
MSKPAKKTTTRMKIVRATILSASLLGFVPLFTQIRADAAATAASTQAAASASLPQVSAPLSTTQTQRQPTTSTQRTVPTHARTRGS